MASDDLVRDVLVRMEPPISALTPDWSDVLERAQPALAPRGCDLRDLL